MEESSKDMEVAPGSEGGAMAEGVSEDQYRSFNEFLVSYQGRS